MSLLALLVMLAVPDDPDAALSQLARYGDVPECQREETIRKTAFDHEHVFSRPRVLPALAGKTPELLPYLEHANRRVVLRAVALLCHSDGDEVPARVMAVARQFPCEEELVFAAIALSVSDVGVVAPCTEKQKLAPRLAPARTLASWPSEPETAKAISSGDKSAFERMLWNLDALEAQRARTAAATLARVDSPTGVLWTLRALKEPNPDPLWRGIVGAQVDALATKRKLSRTAAWAQVISTASVGDRDLLASIEGRWTPVERAQFEKEADQLRRSPELSPFGRAWLEKHASSQHDWMTMRRKLDDFVSYRDRPALRAFMKDEANGINDRLEAAKALALLGDASGLSLWDSDAGLWSEERERRRKLLVDVSHDAPAEVRAKAEALLTQRWIQ